MNEKTREQILAVVLVDCINKCNAMKVDQPTYEQHLKSMLKERLFNEDGQKELPV